jgi:hypothetical protein
MGTHVRQRLFNAYDRVRGNLRRSGEFCRTLVPASVESYFRVEPRASISSGDR